MFPLLLVMKLSTNSAFRIEPLQVTTSLDATQAYSASVRQAFLPKFETEDKDASVASCIVDQVGAECAPSSVLLDCSTKPLR